MSASGGAVDHGCMGQSTYMHEEAPFDYAPERAEAIQPALRAAVEDALKALQLLQAGRTS
jgi:hypothetical protein